MPDLGLRAEHCEQNTRGGLPVPGGDRLSITSFSDRLLDDGRPAEDLAVMNAFFSAYWANWPITPDGRSVPDDFVMVIGLSLVADEHKRVLHDRLTAAIAVFLFSAYPLGCRRDGRLCTLACGGCGGMGGRDT